MTPKELAELDLAVALAVGWKRVGKDWHTRPAHRSSKDYPGTILNDYDGKGEHDGVEAPDGSGTVWLCGCESTASIPPYSSDGAEAMRLLEEYRLDLYSERDGRWMCCKDERSCQFGPTPAIAICRAVVALKAATNGEQAAPQGEGNSAGLSRNWSVTVNVNGRDVLTLANDLQAGDSRINPAEIRRAAEHLLAFIE